MNENRTTWLPLLAVGILTATLGAAQTEQYWTAKVDGDAYDQAVDGAPRSPETVLRCDVSRKIDSVVIRRDDGREVAIDLLCLGGCGEDVISSAEASLHTTFGLSTDFAPARELEKYGAAESLAEEANAVWHFYAILPGIKSRFFRSFDLKVSFLDQSDRLFAGAAGEPLAPVFVENPQDDLSKFELTFAPGKAFRTTTDLVGAYTLFGAAGTRTLLDSSADPLFCVPPSEKLVQLAWSGGYGLGRRILNGLTLSAGISERSELLGTTPIPEPFRGRDETEGTFSLTFDPDSLVVFPAELAAAYAALEQHVGLNKANHVELNYADSKTCYDKAPIQCLQEVSGITIRGRWLAALLPKIEAKSIDQFALVAASGSVFESLAEDSLETITLTWDLSTALDSAKHRREAIKALASHIALVERERRFDQELLVRSTEIRVPRGFPVPVQLIAGYRDEETTKLKPKTVSWEVKEVSNENIRISATGLLETKDVWSGVAYAWVVACDDVGNCTEGTKITIDVY